MSYDVMVFDFVVVLCEVVVFIVWFECQVEWNEEYDYDDVLVSVLVLQVWYVDIIIEYLLMNGLFVDDDDDWLQVIDYSVGCQVIYVVFVYLVVEYVYGWVQEFVYQYGLGFFDVSGDGVIVYFDGIILILV